VDDARRAKAGKRLKVLIQSQCEAFDGSLRALFATLPKGERPACGPGCASCCHVNVDASLGEIVLAAEWVAEHLDEPARADLARRLELHAAQVGPLSDEERWSRRIPCALLTAEGHCSIHEARPLRCRAFVSHDRSLCDAAYRGEADTLPPEPNELAVLIGNAEGRLERTNLRAGVSPAMFRFEEALAIALPHASRGRLLPFALELLLTAEKQPA
jgi:hypothetical protein